MYTLELWYSVYLVAKYVVQYKKKLKYCRLKKKYTAENLHSTGSKFLFNKNCLFLVHIVENEDYITGKAF